MSKISNVITMLQLLSNGKKYSIQELSDILEVTPRMIRIYKDELEKSGVYIDTIMGPYGGYVLNQSIRIPSRKFKKNDYELLDRYIEMEVDINQKEKIINLKDKLRGVYFGSKQEKIDENIIDDKYNVIMRAIKEKRKLKILYYTYGKGELERVIHPRDIFLFKDGWYSSAYCELRNDFRHFELKRIRKYELLDEYF